MAKQLPTLYMTQQHILCTSTASSKTEPIIWNAGALLALRSISVIAVQAPTKLNTKHIHQLNATDDLPSGVIPLAVDHRIHHKYPKLLNIPLLNRDYDTVHVPRKTMLGTLHQIDSENIEVSNALWTKENSNTANSPAKPQICHLNQVSNKNNIIWSKWYFYRVHKDHKKLKISPLHVIKGITIALYQNHHWM